MIEAGSCERRRCPLTAVLGAVGALILAPSGASAAPLSAPSSVTAVAVSSSAIDVRWIDTNNDESGYEVWHSLDGATFTRLEPTTSPNQERYTHGSLAAGTTHYYRVRAKRNGNGNKDFFSDFAPDPGSASARTVATTTTTTWSTTTTTLGGGDTTPPSVPTGVTVTAPTCNSTRVSWNASTDTGGAGLRGYRVYGWRNSQTTFLREVTASPFTEGNLSGSTLYWYKVSAIDYAGNESAQSGWLSATTPACGGTTTTTILATTTTTTLPNTDARWGRDAGTSGSDRGLAVAVEDGGGVVVVGDVAAGTVDFGGGALTTDTNEAFVARYAANGAHAWSRVATTSGLARGSTAEGVAVDPSGNVVVVGSFAGAGTFGGPWLTSAGDLDVFVVKYSAAGTHLWSRRIGSPEKDWAVGVAVDQQGNVIVAGGSWSAGAAQLDAGGALISSNGFVAKYSGAGAPLWSRGVGAQQAFPEAVTVDGGGNVFVAGGYWGTVNLGGGALTATGTDMFLMKMAGTTGAHLWSRAGGGSGEDRALGLATGSDGGVVVTGEFMNTATFGNTTLTSAGGFDGFAAKYSTSGGVQWTRRFGGSAIDKGTAVAVDPITNDVVVTGYFNETASFGGETLTSLTGSDDLFVARYSSTGAHKSSQHFRANGQTRGTGVAIHTATGNLAVSGFFGYRIDVDDGAGYRYAVGWSDVLVVSLP